jgi:predicted metal-dependent phosphoesterase TrpH
MIDLHTHTNISDGTDTPAQLINKALASGINVLALTDHDSIAGWHEATVHLRPGLDLVLGAEISCQTEDGISVHMLGLLFDSAHQELQEVLAQTRENRHGRMEKIIGRMNSAGIEISMDVTVTLSVLKGKTIFWPRAENTDFILTVGNARPLDQCLQHATTEMLRWLEQDYLLDPLGAHLLLSQCVRYDLGNMFDPAYTMVCKMPKKYLPVVS